MKAPDFTLPDQSGKTHSLSDFAGSWLLVYFYPQDDTAGCTKEACNFRDNIEEFTKRNIKIVGISKDSVYSHTKFSEKYHLNFPILSDESLAVIKAYGVWGKPLLGLGPEGVNRTSFLVDPKGEIVKEYANVNPLGHDSEVLKDFDEKRY